MSAPEGTYNPLRRIAGEYLLRRGPVRLGALEFQVLRHAEGMALFIQELAPIPVSVSYVLPCMPVNGRRILTARISEQDIKPHEPPLTWAGMLKQIEDLGEYYREAVQALAGTINHGSPVIDTELIALDRIELELRALAGISEEAPL